MDLNLVLSYTFYALLCVTFVSTIVSIFCIYGNGCRYSVLFDFIFFSIAIISLIFAGIAKPEYTTKTHQIMKITNTKYFTYDKHKYMFHSLSNAKIKHSKTERSYVVTVSVPKNKLRIKSSATKKNETVVYLSSKDYRKIIK